MMSNVVLTRAIAGLWVAGLLACSERAAGPASACCVPGPDASGGASAGADGSEGMAGASSGSSGDDGGDRPATSDAATPSDAAPPPDAAASSDAAPPEPVVRARPIVAAPTYAGSVDNSTECSRTYATSGFEPDSAPGTRHPLFFYLAGTNFTVDEQAFRASTAPAAGAVTEAMARRGFVALWVEYDDGAIGWLSDHVGQLACLFGSGNASSLLAAACALPNVDCELGIAAWGHSQGAYMAEAAASFDPRVRAVWTTGYGGDASTALPSNRLRVVNGEADTLNGSVAVLNPIAGFSATECPDDGRGQCLRDDGSGWIIVRRADLARPELSSADHCWFDRRACSDAMTNLEPNWIDPASAKPFALEGNADWLAHTARTP
jgi:hypothetical protein